MITKEIFKEYMTRKCDHHTWLSHNQKTRLSLLKKMIEMDLGKDKVDEQLSDEGDNHFDTLYEYTRYYPKECEEILNTMKIDPISKLILGMKDYQEISNLSRLWFMEHFKGNARRADTIDGTLDGEAIYDQVTIESNTRRLLSDASVTIIFEGQMSYHGLVARWDALVKKNQSYHLYEVKGSNSVYKRNSMNLKDEFLHDIFFQYYVYKHCGLDISKISFLHLNSDYENSPFSDVFYPFDLNNIMQLFKECHDTTSDQIPILEFLDEQNLELSKEVQDLQTFVSQSSAPNPSVKYGCRKCLLMSECHPTMDDHHILNLTCDGAAGGTHTRTKKLIESGVFQMSDITNPFLDHEYPETKIAKDQKTKKEKDKRSLARLQINYAKGLIKEMNHFDFERMKVLLPDYKFPLVFFDFESFSYPIPLVTQAQPWEQVCSQYSMHVVKEGYDLIQHDYDGKEETGRIQHFEFIGNPKSDQFVSPDLHLLQQLEKDLFQSGIDWNKDSFTMVFYNKSYEISRFKRLMEKYPLYKPFIEQCLKQVVDLRDFFINGCWYRKDFNGRTSLKVVVKSLVKDPEFKERYYNDDQFIERLDYASGSIKNGGVALDAYQSLLRKVLIEGDALEHDSILEALRYYCKIDTWSNVVIFDLLRKIYNEHKQGKFINW
jgi:Domain of unknown function(DUF2779)